MLELTLQALSLLSTSSSGAFCWPRHLGQEETRVMKPDMKDAQIGQKVNYIMLLTLTFLKNTLDFLQAELRLGEGKKKASGSSCDKLPCVKPPVHIITVPDIIGS